MNHPRTFSVLAGLMIAAGLPPWGWWPLTICGLALWFRLIDVVSPRTRFRRSLLVGAAWAYPSTIWMFDLTPPGWPFAAGVFALIVAFAGWATPGTRGSRRVVFPTALGLAALIRWSWPLGGVPISTLAMAGADTPLAWSARLFGSPLLVVMMGLAGVVLSDLLQRNRSALLGLAVLIVVPLFASLPFTGAHGGDNIRVAVVQGGGPQNTRADLCQNRLVFERHMAASSLIDEPVDLVLWPEDVIHPSPDQATSTRCEEPLLGRTEAEERLQQLAVDLEATLVTGWFEVAEDLSANLNYSIVMDADGVIGDRYEKVRLVPFGEFVPFRGFIERFSDELPGRDVRVGTSEAVLDTDLGPLGVAISWEIFFDHRARDAIGNGGQVLLNPTNGSSYWLTIVQSQQIASSKLRALETDRWVLQAAPTGFSAIISPDGDVVQRTGVSEQKVLIDTIQLRQGRTLAVAWGAWPVLLSSLIVLIVVHLSFWRYWLTQRVSRYRQNGG